MHKHRRESQTNIHIRTSQICDLVKKKKKDIVQKQFKKKEKEKEKNTYV